MLTHSTILKEVQWKLQASTSFRFSFRKGALLYINPFIPASNQHETYPYDIHTLSRKKGSNNTLIGKKLLSRSNMKFSFNLEFTRKCITASGQN